MNFNIGTLSFYYSNWRNSVIVLNSDKRIIMLPCGVEWLDHGCALIKLFCTRNLQLYFPHAITYSHSIMLVFQRDQWCYWWFKGSCNWKWVVVYILSTVMWAAECLLYDRSFWYFYLNDEKLDKCIIVMKSGSISGKTQF